MHHAVRDDRNWFQKHPMAIVRFRSMVHGEFEPLNSIGEHPPLFRPSICRPDAPLHWIAVVDLMRLSGVVDDDSTEPTMRVRMQIPALRSVERRKKVETELLNAIAKELLNSIDTNDNNVAA